MQARTLAKFVRAAGVAAAITTLGAWTGASAGDRDPHRPLVIPKTGERCADDPKCHNRWHPAIPPVARAKSGDVVVFGTRDAFDHSLDRDSTAADVVALNLNLVHPLTGPLYVEGAKAGDALAITLLDVAPDSFGYTMSDIDPALVGRASAPKPAPALRVPLHPGALEFYRDHG